jgi:hypothetical protein
MKKTQPMGYTSEAFPLIFEKKKKYRFFLVFGKGGQTGRWN